MIRQLTVNEREAHSAAGMAADTAWPQLTSQLPCSAEETAGLFTFFWEADTTVILSIISPLQLN